MALTYIYIFGSVIVVSLISLIGVITLSMNRTMLKSSISFLVALAIGALLGDALIHLIPEAFEEMESPMTVSLLVIAGFLFFFVLEKFFHWHHGTHGTQEHTSDCDENDPDCHPTPKPVGKMIIVSDGIHNIIDGMVIAASYFVSIEVGVATTIAIILHEIPQEIADFGVLIHSGYTRSRALLVNFLSALTAIGGAVVTVFLGSFVDVFILFMLPIAAGNFIYIASSDLTPELHKEDPTTKHTIIQLIAIFVGILAMYLLVYVE